jgi:hypothetical protein
MQKQPNDYDRSLPQTEARNPHAFPPHFIQMRFVQANAPIAANSRHVFHVGKPHLDLLALTSRTTRRSMQRLSFN